MSKTLLRNTPVWFHTSTHRASEDVHRRSSTWRDHLWIQLTARMEAWIDEAGPNGNRHRRLQADCHVRDLVKCARCGAKFRLNPVVLSGWVQRGGVIADWPCTDSGWDPDGSLVCVGEAQRECQTRQVEAALSSDDT